MQVDHPFFPPSSAETQLENGAIENLLDKLNGQLSLKRDQSACLDGPYPAEIMQRWKELAFKKMVQNEFAHKRISRLEKELDQCRRNKLADFDLAERLKARNMELENELLAKQELIERLNEGLDSIKMDRNNLKIKDEENGQNIMKINEGFASLKSQIELLSRSFQVKAMLLEKRMVFAMDRIVVIAAVHKESKCGISKELTALKKELEQMLIDRKLLVQHLIQRQDNEVLSEGISNYSIVDKSFDRLGLLESLSDALLEL